MAQQRKSKAEQEKEESRKLFLTFQVINRFFDLVNSMVRFGGWATLIYIGVVLPLRLTAGKQTVVNFVYRAVLDLKLHMVVPWAAVVLFGGLWQWERRLRKKTVAREHRRIEELERSLDPGRTSSGLTVMGDNPRDSS